MFIKTQLFKKTSVSGYSPLSSDRFGFTTAFAGEGLHYSTERNEGFVFHKQLLQRVLESNLSFALFWNSCSSLRKLFKSFKLMLSFLTSPQTLFQKVRRLKMHFGSLQSLERSALLNRCCFYFNQGDSSLATTIF